MKLVEILNVLPGNCMSAPGGKETNFVREPPFYYIFGHIVFPVRDRLTKGNTQRRTFSALLSYSYNLLSNNMG